jgi:hypothetical protein
MSATPQDYQVGTQAALTVIEADVDKEVPSFFRGEISDDDLMQIASEVAKAVIDAVDVRRATEQQVAK